MSNIGTALGTDVNALEELNRAAVATVLARAGRGAVLPLPEHRPSRPGDLRSNLVDATLAGRVLGWAGSRLSVSVRDCSLTAEWFAALGDRPKAVAAVTRIFLAEI